MPPLSWLSFYAYAEDVIVSLRLRIVTYLLTYLLTYLITDESWNRVRIDPLQLVLMVLHNSEGTSQWVQNAKIFGSTCPAWRSHVSTCMSLQQWSIAPPPWVGSNVRRTQFVTWATSLDHGAWQAQATKRSHIGSIWTRFVIAYWHLHRELVFNIRE